MAWLVSFMKRVIESTPLFFFFFTTNRFFYLLNLHENIEKLFALKMGKNCEIMCKHRHAFSFNPSFTWTWSNIYSSKWIIEKGSNIEDWDGRITRSQKVWRQKDICIHCEPINKEMKVEEFINPMTRF